jgi:hypothetical protein
MSNLENRNAARIDEGTNTPLYPNLGPAVAKHRRLNDETPEGRKAYGQAVHAAIRALQRSELRRAGVNRSEGRPMCASGTAHTEGKDILKAIRAQHRNATQAAANGPTFARTEDQLEADYYRAMLRTRGVDPNKIEDLVGPGHPAYRNSTLWLKAAWNVIKTKRGTPYLVEAKAEPVEVEVAPAPQPKKRGRPFGSKNKPKSTPETQPMPAFSKGDRVSYTGKAGATHSATVVRYVKSRNVVTIDFDAAPEGSTYTRFDASPANVKHETPAEPEPKPVKPRVPSHYLSSASRVAYHAAM